MYRGLLVDGVVLFHHAADATFVEGVGEGRRFGGAPETDHAERLVTPVLG
jgi:hypothetical protein